jgi:hypothetical protein
VVSLGLQNELVNAFTAKHRLSTGRSHLKSQTDQPLTNDEVVHGPAQLRYWFATDTTDNGSPSGQLHQKSQTAKGLTFMWLSLKEIRERQEGSASMFPSALLL